MIGFGLPGGYEWIVILVIVLLLFGHRLPGMARSLGSGITEFKRGLKDGSKDAADGPGNPDSGKPGSAGSASASSALGSREAKVDDPGQPKA